MKDANVHLKISVLCLTYVGFWPHDIKNRIWALLYRTYFKITLAIYVVLVFSQFVEIYMIVGNGLEEFSFMLGINLLYNLGLIKLWVISGKDVKRLVLKIRTTERNIFARDGESVRQTYGKFARMNRRVNLTLLVIGLTCDFMFCFTPIFTELVDPPEVLFEVVNNSTVVYKARPLPIVSWFPFDRYKYYKTAYAWHMIVLMNIPVYLIACDNLFYGLIIFAIGQLKILQESLLEVKGGDGEAVRKCLEYHKRIILYVKELSDAMRTFLMLDFAACGLQIAVIGFQAAVVLRAFWSVLDSCGTFFVTLVQFWYYFAMVQKHKKLATMNTLHLKNSINKAYFQADISFQLLNTVTYLITMMVQLFLFYWYGNEIMVESTKVSNAIWESEWHLNDPKIKRNLLIIMMRAQKPLTLSIGPFYQMSTETMVSILKAGYSYAAVMRRLYSDKSV